MHPWTICGIATRRCPWDPIRTTKNGCAKPDIGAQIERVLNRFGQLGWSNQSIPVAYSFGGMGSAGTLTL
jgi:hypothetical protein